MNATAMHRASRLASLLPLLLLMSAHLRAQITLGGHTGSVFTAYFSPDGSRAITASATQ